ncbi:MAG: hypothetical protein DDT34_02510 [Firmicutes bacterium]|nr:hypothetical protein [Bacillota bacterium]
MSSGWFCWKAEECDCLKVVVCPVQTVIRRHWSPGLVPGLVWHDHEEAVVQSSLGFVDIVIDQDLGPIAFGKHRLAKVAAGLA